jgi:glycosyltransferase involved in cell wall biosynthesis
MNLLILNTFDNLGGAAIATYRLHQGFRSIGIHSNLLVQTKKTNNQHVFGPSTPFQKTLANLRPELDGVVTKLYRNREKVFFSSAWLPENLASKVTKYKPKVVHLFWVGGGFLRIETLKKINQPIVWTLHDMWPFTGGCHYDNECGKFQQSCGNCPVLRSGRERDLSRHVWRRKKKSWQGIPIVVVATSQWLADMARMSSIFKDLRIEVIPNGLNTEKYKPINKETARAAYNLPQDKKLILFSAFSATSDKRKGGQYLAQSIEKLSREDWWKNAELVILGASKPQNPQEFNIGMKVHYMGYLHDEISQVLLYSASDVMVAPSMQENLSNTVMESLSCGTPVVAFNIGGMPDMIDHLENGYLATPFNSDDLADGIQWVLESEERHNLLSRHARKSVQKRFSIKKVANSYLNLYREILK